MEGTRAKVTHTGPWHCETSAPNNTISNKYHNKNNRISHCQTSPSQHQHHNKPTRNVPIYGKKLLYPLSARLYLQWQSFSFPSSSTFGLYPHCIAKGRRILFGACWQDTDSYHQTAGRCVYQVGCLKRPRDTGPGIGDVITANGLHISIAQDRSLQSQNNTFGQTDNSPRMCIQDLTLLWSCNCV